MKHCLWGSMNIDTVLHGSLREQRLEHSEIEASTNQLAYATGQAEYFCRLFSINTLPILHQKGNVTAEYLREILIPTRVQLHKHNAPTTGFLS